MIGTVKGDLHDIGKNLVGMMWKGANIEVIDLGTNVPPERYVEAARNHDARIIGISALLTTTMIGMADVVRASATRGSAMSGSSSAGARDGRVRAGDRRRRLCPRRGIGRRGREGGPGPVKAAFRRVARAASDATRAVA